jgi:hypothetical protein
MWASKVSEQGLRLSRVQQLRKAMRPQMWDKLVMKMSWDGKGGREDGKKTGG